jgi:hypothetical protein
MAQRKRAINSPAMTLPIKRGRAKRIAEKIMKKAGFLRTPRSALRASPVSMRNSEKANQSSSGGVTPQERRVTIHCRFPE